MTLFDILQFIGWIGGALLGLTYGRELFGDVGAWAGGILGLVAGHFVGRAPFLLAWRSLAIEKKSTEELREIIAGDQYFIYHLALAALMARGENVDQHQQKLLEMLQCDDEDKRKFAWCSFQLAFPELAKLIPEYDPFAETECCRNQVQHLDLPRTD